MPVMNGFEARRLIRKMEKGYGVHIPILALTAHTSGEETNMTKEAGMDAHLDKPLKADHLLDAIRNMHNDSLNWRVVPTQHLVLAQKLAFLFLCLVVSTSSRLYHNHAKLITMEGLVSFAGKIIINQYHKNAKCLKRLPRSS